MTKGESTKVIETIDGLCRSEIREHDADLFYGVTDMEIDSYKGWAKQVVYASYNRINGYDSLLQICKTVKGTIRGYNAVTEVATILGLAISETNL